MCVLASRVIHLISLQHCVRRCDFPLSTHESRFEVEMKNDGKSDFQKSDFEISRNLDFEVILSCCNLLPAYWRGFGSLEAFSHARISIFIRYQHNQNICIIEYNSWYIAFYNMKIHIWEPGWGGVVRQYIGNLPNPYRKIRSDRSPLFQMAITPSSDKIFTSVFFCRSRIILLLDKVA